MKSMLALGVGLVVALAPGGTAFADVEPHSTGGGKAYGNCQHSSAGGTHKPLDGSAGKGNGGHVVKGVQPTLPCPVEVKTPVDSTVDTEEPVFDGGENDEYDAPAM